MTLSALVAVVDPAAAASGDINVKTTDTDPGGTGRWRPPGDVPFDFPENRRVKVRVCLQHHKTGALKFCSAWKYGNTT